MKLKTELCLYVAFIFICVFGTAKSQVLRSDESDAKQTSVTLQSLLEEMSDRDNLSRFPEPVYRSLQASSYNRASVRRGEPGWFADSDGLGFIRTEQVDGRTEWVIMEHVGPGCITKIWTPFFYYGFGDRIGPNVKIYLDDSKEPVIDDSLIELVTEKLFVKPPFSSLTARAGNLYLPIPFGRSCKITMDTKPFYNIINYRGYPAGTEVETFTMEQYDAAQSQLAKIGKKLLAAPPYNKGQHLQAGGSIKAEEAISIELPKGNAAVRHLSIELDPEEIIANPAALRSTVLKIDFDGMQTVWCPVGDFFCSANAINEMQTWTRTVTDSGLMSCRWVMPYRRKGKISLVNLGGETVSAKLEVQVGQWDWDNRSMHFYTGWRSDDVLPGTPFRDWNFVDIKGKGVFVGDAWTVLNPDRGWWGEGDEKIYVDQAYEEKFPTHFGTGTEDYYGWAGGVNPVKDDVFQHPYLANVTVGSTAENNPRGFNICTRIRALDAIVFNKRLVFDMEASPGTQIRNPWNLLCYSAVMFWYALPGATSNRVPLPEEAAKPITTLESLDQQAKAISQADVKRIKGAIEFEGLEPSAKSNGLHCGPQRPAVAFKPDIIWSGGEHFFIAGSNIGDYVEFKFTEQFGPVQMLLYVTRSYDFGIVRLYVNGQTVNDQVDLYSRQPVVGDPIDLGKITPKDNAIVLRMELVGRNKEAKGNGSYMGLDCVVMESGETVGCIAPGDISATSTRAAEVKRPIRLFIVAGQSNAMGYNNILEYQKGAAEFPKELLHQPCIMFWQAASSGQEQTNSWSTLRRRVEIN